MKYKIITLFFIALALSFFCQTVMAENDGKTVDVKKQAQSLMDIGAEEAGLKEKNKEAKSPGVLIAEMVKIFMGVMGTILIALVVYGGFVLLNANGDDEKVKSAYKIIEGAVIGLIIALSAYAIANFVAKKAMETTGFGVSVLDYNQQV